MPAPRRKNLVPQEGSTATLHEHCWAKTLPDGSPGISVLGHCVNVGSVAKAIIERVPEFLKSSLAADAGAILAALHDVGKVSPGFQAKCAQWLADRGLAKQSRLESWGTCESDHAKIGQRTVQQLLNKSCFLYAAAIGAHHGRVKGDRIPPFAEANSTTWEDQRRRLAKELIDLFGPLPIADLRDSMLWWMAGLIAVSDWLGSNERYFPPSGEVEEARALERARNTLEQIGWETPQLRKRAVFADLFPGYTANSLQTAAIDAVTSPGIYLIEGPMGSGKTEAALAIGARLVQLKQASGIYFALPTQVTSNRIYLRMQQFLANCAADPFQLRLAHGSSWLQETKPPLQLQPTATDVESDENSRSARSWFASPKRSLLAPFGVGTVDQALLGIVAANHFFVRQFALAGKVVILDEVHSYDLYTGTLIDVLVRRLRELQCTVVILSATLTQERRRQLLQVNLELPLCAAYPLISGYSDRVIEARCEPPPAKVVSILKVGRLPLEDACIEQARHGLCVLWIRNTVDEAQEAYRRLQAANFEGGPNIGLIHARFPYFRREELEACWMESLGKDSKTRPAGCVLVSTQMAEQSVDIDADLLISDLAPTDMLLQRIGRLWRHDRPKRPSRRPEIWLLTPQLDEATLRRLPVKELCRVLGKSARVYAPYVLLRTLEQWIRLNKICLPEEIRPVLEATYATPGASEPAAWRKLRIRLEEEKARMTSLACSATNIFFNPALPDEEGVQTRYGSYPTARLLLANSVIPQDKHSVCLELLTGDAVKAHDRNWDLTAAKGIYRNLVNVPRWAVASTLRYMPPWLANYVHPPCAIGIVRSDGGIRWPGEETQTGLSFHEKLGIVIDRTQTPRVPEEEIDESYD